MDQSMRQDVLAVLRQSPLGILVRQLQGAVLDGEGSPEGAVAAPVGTLYRDRDGGPGTTLYVKESGTGNTGWGAK